MSIFQLVLREINHRKGNFILSVVAIALTLCLSIYCISLLSDYDAKTSAMLEKQKQDTQAQLKQHNEQTETVLQSLENDIRKSMKGLGFNVYLFPKDEPIEKIKERGYSIKTIPQEYANKLADSKVVTINHLLPQLARRVQWKEQNRGITLIGVAGQVPMAHRNHMKPIMQPLEAGTVFLGHDLHKPFGIKVGDMVTINAKQYKVAKTYPPRDFRDDGTAWIHLAEMQKMFNLEGQISSIKCLGCNCASADRVGTIRKELEAIIPDIQIIEVGSKALVRAEARVKTSKRADTVRTQIITQANEKMASIAATRDESRKSLETLNHYLVPLLLIIAFITLTILCVLNVRQRKEEVGILRALGVKTSKILSLFLIRALIIGILASAVALIVAFSMSTEISSTMLLILVIAPPLIALTSTWLPALAAATQPPLNALKND